MTKMAVKRIGVVEKHCSAFALFSRNFHLRTNEVQVSKRLNKGRIEGGSAKMKNAKILKNRPYVRESFIPRIQYLVWWISIVCLHVLVCVVDFHVCLHV